MPFEPSDQIQDVLRCTESSGVNPAISDSSTFTFPTPEAMNASFAGEPDAGFLYSRHSNPSTLALATALARMEGTEAALVTGSGMAAISATLLQLCDAGTEIVSSRTVYGGTYALLKNFLPRFNIATRFVNVLDLTAVRAAITPQTRVIYTEGISNPLLEVADLAALADIAHAHGLPLVVDNTFSPLILSPAMLGADIVLHSLTKFINGTSDALGGCVCASQSFIDQLLDVNSGATMLLGPVLDSLRAASILKNLHSLHIRMQKHSANALHLAQRLQDAGFKVHYPGLPAHPQHTRLTRLMNPDYGYGGMLVLDVETKEVADRLLVLMQKAQIGYIAVSLGYFKTLFSAPGRSTSSEIPLEDQQAMGLSDGMIRFAIGLDHNIERTWERLATCLEAVALRHPQTA